jgi:RNA polymerase sigma-70 factor, ECF subfamily
MPDALERDQDIVQLIERGDTEAAFGRLVDRYEQKVYRLCCGLLRDRVLAEDAAQESLLRIWKSLAKYDARAALSTWIYTIARNRCLTALERRQAAESLVQRDAGGQLEHAAAAPAPNPDPMAASTSLRALVDGLPERYRQALTLFYFEERSVGETGAMLGLPDGTVKTNLARGRALLLERISQLGLCDPLLWLEEAT